MKLRPVPTRPIGCRNTAFDGFRSRPATRSRRLPSRTSSRSSPHPRARKAAAGREVHLVLETDDPTRRAISLATPDGRPPPLYQRMNATFTTCRMGSSAPATHGYYADYEASPILRRARGAGRGLHLSGEVLPPPRRRQARRAERFLRPTAFVQFPRAEPRPDRNPLSAAAVGAWRRAPLRALTAILALGASDPAAVHGRGMGERAAFPFFCDFARRVLLQRCFWAAARVRP